MEGVHCHCPGPVKFKDPEVKLRQEEAMKILNQAKANALAYVVPNQDPQEKLLTVTACLYVLVLLRFVTGRVVLCIKEMLI